MWWWYICSYVIIIFMLQNSKWAKWVKGIESQSVSMVLQSSGKGPLSQLRGAWWFWICQYSIYIHRQRICVWGWKSIYRQWLGPVNIMPSFKYLLFDICILKGPAVFLQMKVSYLLVCLIQYKCKGIQHALGPWGGTTPVSGSSGCGAILEWKVSLEFV